MTAPELDAWAATVRQVLQTPYPYGAAHVSLGPDDVEVTPERLHPAFHGSLDWHSSAHMQWSAVTLLPALDDAARAPLVALLDARLTGANVAAEVRYLREHPSYERPYGWAWAAMLAAAARTSTAPEAAVWADALAPLADTLADLLNAWLPRLAHPVRHGVHGNTAFAFALAHEAFGALGRADVQATVAAHAVAWFGGDRDYPSRWEPSGTDFLSPALCEADLLRRVLPAPEFDAWLAGFLPHLGRPGDPLLEVPTVLDPSDGHAAHLYGLALSRAWLLRTLLPHLDENLRAGVAAAANRQVAAVERVVVEGDFMATHWLVSFALLARRAAAGAPGPDWAA